jgi:class 3 adenylate cyclase/tetratricopeptide (TPR) repeat protein
MIRHIPPFILNKAENGEQHGSFEGYVLLLDIVDFTHISESFQRDNLHGADSIGALLNQISEGPINSIQKYGGFVSLFIGDAICAIFPDTEPTGVLSALTEIREFLSSFKIPGPNLTNSSIAIRETLSFGQIEWEIYPNPYQWEYLFFGDPFVEGVAVSGLEGKHTYTPKAIKNIGRKNFHRVAGEIRLDLPPMELRARQVCYLHRSQSQALFIHKNYRDLAPTNEIRNVAACFVGLREIRDPGQALRNLHILADRFHGFVNKIDYSESHPVAVVLFGIPNSLGKTVYQACEFALELATIEPALSFGISCGYAYAGYIGSDGVREYTALGHCMNIAARLQSGASMATLICDAGIYREVGAMHDMQLLGTIQLKGISKELSFYSLQRRTCLQEKQFRNSFVGRHEELRFLDYVKGTALKHNRNCILHVNGDPGLGKSRLVWHFIQEQSDVQIFCSSCSLHKSPPFGIFAQILTKFFGISEEMNSKEISERISIVFRAKKWNEKHPQNIQIVLAMLMGADVSQSIVATWNAEQRVNNIFTAFRAFLSNIQQEKPILWMLDDGQWLDPDSRKLLENLNPEALNPLIIMSPCRLLEDGGPVILKLQHFARYDLHLSVLETDEQYLLLKQILADKQIALKTLHQIVQKSGGYPLYLEQMAYYLLERCKDCKKNELLSHPKSISSFSISDIINSRLDGFSDEMRACIYHAAILGMQFDIKLLEQILNQNVSHELQLGLNHRLWELVTRNRYVFTHVLIRDIVYERLLRANVKELHKRTAIAMVRLHGEGDSSHADEIAQQYFKAECIPEAADYLFKASRHHMKMSNWRMGITMQRRATFLSGRHFGFGSPEHVENLFWMGLSYHYIQHFPQAEHIYQLVLQHKGRHLKADDPRMSPYLNNLGRFYKDTARYVEAEALLRQSLAIEHHWGPGSTNVADRLNNLASLYNKQGKWLKALAYSRKALKIFEHCSHHERDFFVALLKMNIGYLHLNIGDSVKAEEYGRQALCLFRKSCGATNPRLAGCYQLLGQIYSLQGKYPEAEKEFLTARHKYGKFFGNDCPDYARVNLNLGDLFELMGNPTRAARYWKKGANVLLRTMPEDHPMSREALLRMQKAESLQPHR